MFLTSLSLSLALSWHTHEHPHARTRKQRLPFANTFRTAPRDRTAPRSLSLSPFSLLLLSSFGLSSLLFTLPTTRTLLPIYVPTDAHRQRWIVAPMRCIGTNTSRNATPALLSAIYSPRKRAHFVPVPARTAAASRRTDHVSLRTTQPPPPCSANASRLDGATYKTSHGPHRSFTSSTTLVKIVYRRHCRLQTKMFFINE